MPRVCFIVNPVAGHGRAEKNWDKVKPLVESLGEYTVSFTEGPRHATELARESAEAGCDRVVVFGGDGTLNEAGNGLMGTGAALAVVPTGSANDWVRQFPIPTDIEGAVRLAFGGRRASVDVGVVENSHGRRYFFNMIGTGFDAEVADRVNRLGPLLKAVPGTLPTVVCVILTLFSYRYPTLTLSADGGEPIHAPRAVLSAFGVCGYIGGGMMMLPGAVPNDGLLDYLWVQGIGRLGILGLLSKIYKGKHVDHPRVHVGRAGRVEISASRPLIWHMDGEIGGRLPITVEVIPEALDIILP